MYGKVLIAGVLALALVTALPKDLFHAECDVTWTLTEACDSAQLKIIDQIFLWDNGDCGNGTGQMNMKCMYKHLGTEDKFTYGTHTTWDYGYVDDIDFTFETSDVGCTVFGHSKSRVISFYDYAVNYCNIYNLMEGSGLVNDPGFTEDTDGTRCSFVWERNCTVY